MKTCTRCGTKKRASGFYTNTRTKDGLRSECRECSKEMTRLLRLKKAGGKSDRPGVREVNEALNKALDQIAFAKRVVGQLAEVVAG